MIIEHHIQLNNKGSPWKEKMKKQDPITENLHKYTQKSKKIKTCPKIKRYTRRALAKKKNPKCRRDESPTLT